MATHPDKPPTKKGLIVNHIDVLGFGGMIFGFLVLSSITEVGVDYYYEDMI